MSFYSGTWNFDNFRILTRIRRKRSCERVSITQFFDRKVVEDLKYPNTEFVRAFFIPKQTFGQIKKSHDMRVVQKHGVKGSVKDIQLLINKNVMLINKRIKTNLREFATDEIIWMSPKEDDDFAEYRDDDFLIKVGLNPGEIQLHEFWPIRGPLWDALAKTDTGKVILVEAKAHIPEIVSEPTKAHDQSKLLILKSLRETKQFMEITDKVSWAGKFYQYTNRLSHLYFLREKHNKDVFLVNIYFMGDKTVSGPKTRQEWDSALKVLKTYLGISKNKLSKYMTEIFIDVNELIQ